MSNPQDEAGYQGKERGGEEAGEVEGVIMEEGTPITTYNPSEILESSSLQVYEDAIDLVWRELLRLNSYLFVLEKLLNFPSDPGYLFLGPDRQTFLELVNISFTEGSLLIISKLTTSGNERFAMSRLQKWVRQHMKKGHQKAFDRLMKEIGFGKIVERSRKSVIDIRDNLVAHLIVDENMRPKVSDHKIAFQQIKEIANELNGLFDALCFGHQRSILPIDYSPLVQHPVGSDPRSDIEYFLDLIIKDSYIFRMPEESEYWDRERQRLTPEIIGKLNEYRRKFGMPEL